MNPLPRAALRYLRRGLPVIALTGKTPNVSVFRRGLDDAITPADLEDPRLTDALHLAFDHRDTTGIGVVIPFPYVVVDIDSEEGAARWKALAGDEYMPTRWVARTAHGMHLWFASLEPTPSFRPWGKTGGVDIRGQNSYVAVEPSWHPGYPDEGIEPGPHYTWLLEPDDEGPMEAPGPLLEIIADRNAETRQSAITKRNWRPVRHAVLEGGKLWASFGFEHLIDGTAAAGPGNRNNYLHWAAATMAEEGATDEEFAALKDAALKAGLTAIETKRTIRSARERHHG